MSGKRQLSRNQKICFWSMYICFCLAVGYSVLDQEGWSSAESHVYLFVWVIWLVSAVPIYLWVAKNPDEVDKLFRW
jgi:hypothetical protein